MPLKKGDHSIEVVDYYDETGKTIRIELDPQKTASENAQQYFKKYQKAKTARLEVVLQVEKNKRRTRLFRFIAATNGFSLFPRCCRHS